MRSLADAAGWDWLIARFDIRVVVRLLERENYVDRIP